MDPTQTQGAGVPDISATAGTDDVSLTSTDTTVSQGQPNTSEDQISAPVVTDQKTENTQDQQDLPIDQELLKEQPTDTELIKKLRGIAKMKYEDFQSRVPQTQAEIPADKKEHLELVDGLFQFDIDRGEPTTKAFAEKLAQKDMTIASQALFDLSNVSMNKPGVQGWTLGHELLTRIGLDPYKLPELQAFSRGEIKAEDIGLEQIPDYVPGEYREAYKKLPQVTRADIDVYLGPQGTPDQKAAALQHLSDKMYAIQRENAETEAQQRQAQEIETQIYQETESQVTSSYQGLLESLQNSDILKNVKISSNDLVDSSTKANLLSQIVALGDPRSLLAQQAVKNFESLGVQVEMDKINALMDQIEKNTVLAVKADKLGKQRGADYSTQIQDALNKRGDAVNRLLAMANRYMSQSLAKLSGQVATPAPQGAPPNLTGGTPTTNRPQSVKTFAQLDQEAENVAAALRAQNGAS